RSQATLRPKVSHPPRGARRPSARRRATLRAEPGDPPPEATPPPPRTCGYGRHIGGFATITTPSRRGHGGRDGKDWRDTANVWPVSLGSDVATRRESGAE